VKKSTKKAAVVASGWLGDTIACSAAATSLHEKGYKVDFYILWPQLKPILVNDQRFRTIVYSKFLISYLKRPLFQSRYDLIVREPNGWSYEEPFTSEIRRIAGCEVKTEYELFLPNIIPDLLKGKSRPVIAFARDTEKRAYGRDISDLLKRLSLHADIEWVGLDPKLSSKKGKNKALILDAIKISQSDFFVGPEGGLLWLAAGLGKKCIYFSEHIQELAKKIERGTPTLCLGSTKHFPNGNHIELPAFCSNEVAAETIIQNLINQQ
jgi:uncharacterized protein (DUF427 family)